MIPSPRDVILNGGEAAVRDRTIAGAFDVVDRVPQVARSIPDLADSIAALSPTYGPSEGNRFLRMTVP
jgi:hypothetical protein